jgi:quercetin dioxygenase-like cupin family protein
MDSKSSSLLPLIVRSEQAPSVAPFGLEMRILLSTEATGGAISVILASHRSGEGPPDHFHTSQEEIFFVIEGAYELTINNLTSQVGAGTAVFIPRNTVHRFKNIGATTARMLDWSLPGGQDHYFKAIAALAAGGFSGDRIELSKKFDTFFPSSH